MKHFNNKQQKAPSTSNEHIIYGRHAVLSALSNPKRVIKKLLIAKENKSEFEAKNLNITPIYVEKKK